MADQIEITNAGLEGGPASEVTLLKLVAITKRLALANGVDPKDINREFNYLLKQLKKHTEEVKSNTKSTKDNTNSLDNSTKSINSFSNHLKLASSRLIGTFAGSLTNVTKQFFDNSASMKDFSQHLPVVGSYLGLISEYMDNSLSSFRDLSTTGASFNNSLMELRTSAAETYMSLDKFTSMVSNNSEKLNSFGGTTTMGIAHLKNLNKAVDKHRNNLLNMGLTYESINENLIDYMAMNQGGALQSRRSVQAQADAAAHYTTQLMTLSKLTGKDIKQIKEGQAAKQSDIAFQMKMAKMSEEQRDRINQALATASAQFGETGAMAVKQAIMGYGPLTKETQLMAATMPGVYKSLQDLGNTAKDASLTDTEFQEKQIQAQLNGITSALDSGQSLEAVLGAASAGLDGNSSELLNVFNNIIGNSSKFLDENGKVNRKLLEESIRQGYKETQARDKTTNSAVSFEETIKSIQKILKVALIDSGIFQSFASLIETAANGFKTLFVDTGVLTEAFRYIKTTIETVSNVISAFSTGGFTDGVNEIFKSGTSVFITTLVAGLAGLFAYKKIKSIIPDGLSSLISNRSNSNSSGNNSGSGIGNAGSGALKGLGAGAGSAGKGLFILTKSLKNAGLAAPKILIGATAIGGAITLIGAGLAGAAWVLSKAMPSIAEGFSSFEKIDGKRLIEAGKGIGLLAISLAGFGASSVISSFGNIAGSFVAGVGEFFGASSPLDKLKEFGKVKLDYTGIENNANAMKLFSDAMSGIKTPDVSILSAIGLGIAGLVDQDPISQLKKFGAESVDFKIVTNNAKAMVIFSEAMSGVKTPDLSVLSALSNGIVSFIAQDPLSQLKKFSETQVDFIAVENNAYAMELFSNVMSGVKTPDLSVLSALSNGIVSFIAQDPLSQLKKFSETQVDLDKIKNNAGAIMLYSRSMKELNSTPDLTDVAISIRKLLKLKLIDNLSKFGETEIKNSSVIISNLTNISEFNQALANMKPLESSDVLNQTAKAISSLPEADSFQRLSDFNKIDIGDGTALQEKLKVFDTFNQAMSSYKPADNEIDFSGLISSITGLPKKDQFDDLIYFGSIELPSKEIISNAHALSEYSKAMDAISSVKEMNISGLAQSVQQLINSDIIPNLTYFSELKIDTDKIKTNATSLVDFSSLLSGFKQIPDIQKTLSQLNVPLIQTTMADFANTEFAHDIIKSNAETVTIFSTAFNTIKDIPDITSILKNVNITSLTAKLDAFANETFDLNKIETNSNAVQLFTRGLSGLKEIVIPTFDVHSLAQLMQVIKQYGSETIDSNQLIGINNIALQQFNETLSIIGSLPETTLKLSSIDFNPLLDQMMQFTQVRLDPSIIRDNTQALSTFNETLSILANMPEIDPSFMLSTPIDFIPLNESMIRFSEIYANAESMQLVIPGLYVFKQGMDVISELPNLTMPSLPTDFQNLSDSIISFSIISIDPQSINYIASGVSEYLTALTSISAIPSINLNFDTLKDLNFNYLQTKIFEFQSISANIDTIKTNSQAISVFLSTINAIGTVASFNTNAIDILEDIVDIDFKDINKSLLTFTETTLPYNLILSNINSLKVFTEGFSGLSTIPNDIDDIFENINIKQIITTIAKFSIAKFKVDKITENAVALQVFTAGFSNISKIPDVEDIFDNIDVKQIENIISKFSNMSVDSNKLSTNTKLFSEFTQSISTINESPTNLSKILKAINIKQIEQLLVKFSNMSVDSTKLLNNLDILKPFAETFSLLSDIPTNTSDLFKNINSKQIESVLSNFSKMKINQDRVTKNLDILKPFVETMQMISTDTPLTMPSNDSISVFSNIESNLDTTKIVNYTQALEKLIETIEKFNVNIDQQNITIKDAAVLPTSTPLNQTTNTSDSSSLNSLMQQAVTILARMQEVNERIEKNTKRISTDDIAV